GVVGEAREEERLELVALFGGERSTERAAAELLDEVFAAAFGLDVRRGEAAAQVDDVDLLRRVVRRVVQALDEQVRRRLRVNVVVEDVEDGVVDEGELE